MARRKTRRHKIEWHKVTWYSRLAALIIFIGIIPSVVFYMGVQYEEVIQITYAATSQRSIALDPHPPVVAGTVVDSATLEKNIIGTWKYRDSNTTLTLTKDNNFIEKNTDLNSRSSGLWKLTADSYLVEIYPDGDVSFHINMNDNGILMLTDTSSEPVTHMLRKVQ